MEIENASGAPAVEAETPAVQDVQYESTTQQPDPKPEVVAEPAEPHEEDDDELEAKPRKKQTGYLKKLGRAEAERDAERTKAAELQKELEAYKNPKKPDVELAEPDPNKYNSYGEYQNALRQYDRQVLIKEQAKTIEEALANDKKASKKAADDQAFESQMNKTFEDFSTKLTEFDTTTPGTKAKIEALVNEGKVSDPLLYLVLNSDDSVALASHLANDPSKIAAMNQMNTTQLLREIGRLEGQLTKSPETVRQTKATAPISPVKPQGSGTTKNPAEMDQAEYEKWLYSDRVRR